MEIDTCEKYVLRELENTQNELARLKSVNKVILHNYTKILFENKTNLKGEELIPLLYLISLEDIYDAIISKRSYFRKIDNYELSIIINDGIIYIEIK